LKTQKPFPSHFLFREDPWLCFWYLSVLCTRASLVYWPAIHVVWILLVSEIFPIALMRLFRMNQFFILFYHVSEQWRPGSWNQNVNVSKVTEIQPLLLLENLNLKVENIKWTIHP
jgi:hypothetical protein